MSRPNLSPQAARLPARIIALTLGCAILGLAGCASEPPKTSASETTRTSRSMPSEMAGGKTAPADRITGFQFRPVRQVAVLLPRTGQLADAGTALRDGLLAAHYAASPTARPEIAFYDSSNPGDVPRLYREAVANGADLVVGPLQKEGVEALMGVGQLPVPALALNRVEDNRTPPPNLFMYGLAPEDEAQEAANKAWADGNKVALILAPQDSWGERIRRTFSERWQSLGGVVADSQAYNPIEHDHSANIEELLHIRHSQERHTRLQTTLGHKVQFEPRRRQDAGMVFLVAQNHKARELWTQLQVGRAADLPVYTTSSAYTATPDSRGEAELDGVMFPDLPWLLRDDPADPLSRSALSRSFPQAAGPYARLYAMGIDTYALATAQLEQLTRQPGATMAGRTGTLYLDGDRRIHRRLVWARMSPGGPVLIGSADTPSPRTPAETVARVAAVR